MDDDAQYSDTGDRSDDMHDEEKEEDDHGHDEEEEEDGDPLPPGS